MPVTDNPGKGILFECDEAGCKERFQLYFQGRTAERLRERAIDIGWTVQGETCRCPAHRPDKKISRPV